MSNSTPSVQCLRVLRRSLLAENSQRTPRQKQHTVHTVSRQRFFSTRTRPLQQGTAPDRPPAPPATVGTANGNITEPTPPPAVSMPSTADMQRAIASRVPTPQSGGVSHTIASKLRQSATRATDTYIAYGATQALFRTCSAQASYTIPEDQRMSIMTGKGPPKMAGGEDLGVPDPSTASTSMWWFKDVGLPPTFSTWSQVTYLHMYLLTVRYRALESQSSFNTYQRHLLDHFSHAAEDKMLLLHGMSARGIRNRYLKDLFLQWRGILAAYDEGLVKGDAVLAAAVWRNLFKGVEEVDWTRVSAVVAYMRKAASMLASVEDQDIVHSVEGKDGVFEAARTDVLALVQRRSLGINEDITAEERRVFIFAKGGGATISGIV